MWAQGTTSIMGAQLRSPIGRGDLGMLMARHGYTEQHVLMQLQMLIKLTITQCPSNVPCHKISGTYQYEWDL